MVNREQANSHGVADLLRGRSKIDTPPLHVAHLHGFDSQRNPFESPQPISLRVYVRGRTYWSSFATLRET
jgi:hypothetical protein